MRQSQALRTSTGIKPALLPEAQRSRRGWQQGICCAMFAAVLVGTMGLAASFENAMDLWMFMGVGSVASLWFFFHDVPDAFMVKDCDELSAAFESDVPVLFKRCIPAELTSWDFVFLPNSTQNIYPVCDSKLTRFTQSFEGLDGSRTSVVEVVPCSGRTLAQKMERFWRPTQEQGAEASHVYMMDDGELAEVTRGLERNGVVPQGFKFQGSVATMIHFFAQGFSNVRFLHSHLDRVFSFGLGTREWHLVNPKHHGKFKRRWTLNNLVMATRESVEAPRVRLVQEKGDILVMPPWWMHKTVPVDSSKERGVNFNIHVLAEGQFLGIAVRLTHHFGLFEGLRPSE